MQTEYVAVVQQYIQTHDISITQVSRMKYSGGVMNIVHVDSRFRIRIDRKWTAWWTKKWKTLSEEAFAEWIKPKVIDFVMEHDPSSPMSECNIQSY